MYSFSNNKDPYSYSNDKDEQLSASLDTVCFAITTNQLVLLLDTILQRFAYYKKPVKKDNKLLESVFTQAGGEAKKKYNELLENV